MTENPSAGCLFLEALEDGRLACGAGSKTSWRLSTEYLETFCTTARFKRCAIYRQATAEAPPKHREEAKPAEQSSSTMALESEQGAEKDSTAQVPARTDVAPEVHSAPRADHAAGGRRVRRVREDRQP